MSKPGVYLDEDEAVERLRRFTERDAEFAGEMERRRWSRPGSAVRYDLDARKSLITWSAVDPNILDVKRFVRSFAVVDRTTAAEVAIWVSEEFHGRFATDKTLNLIRLNILRRLDACGF